MEENSEASKNGRNRKSNLLLIGLMTALALMLGVVGMSAAADDPDGRPTPDASAVEQVSPYAGVVDSTLELLQQAPSIERYVNAHSIPADLLIAANLADSSKTVTPEETRPNGVVTFTITVVNSGDSDVVAKVTDKLPKELEYISSECDALLTTTCEEDGGTITWEGTAIAGQEAVISIAARVSESAEPGDEIVNTAKIEADGDTINREATVTVVQTKSSMLQYLPWAQIGLEQITEPGPVALTAGSPNGNNAWNLSWTPSPGATNFELQEASTPSFSDAKTYVLVGSDTGLLISKEPSPSNEYYYRIRSTILEKVGPWSNTEYVVGGYFDNFDDVNTGWSMRRTTYKEKVHGFYETLNNQTWYVMQVLDKWDWGIASPGKPAPRLPYVILYDVKIANSANLLSSGFVFGADWPGGNCPSDPNSFDGVYLHQECFNHFYNTNVIFYADLKLLFERVDQLVWCLECGGSPMKRIGDINPGSATDLYGVDPEGWNSYRIEVREDSIKVYASNRGGTPSLQKTYTDTRWVHDPYFGVFASTDEYNNSTWRFDNVQLLPLDE